MQNLAKHCEFVTFLNEALRDKFVCGLRSEAIKQKLLTEDNLTFSRAYQTAMGMELAEGQVKVMGAETVTVNKLKFQLRYQSRSASNQARGASQSQNQDQSRTTNSHNQSSHKKCKRCLRIHGDGNKCPAINWKCFA